MNLARRFRLIFWGTLVFFYLGCILAFTLGDGPSNIIYRGQEVRGFPLFVANLILIPLVSALLAGMSVVPEFIITRLRRKNRNQNPNFGG